MFYRKAMRVGFLSAIRTILSLKGIFAVFARGHKKSRPDNSGRLSSDFNCQKPISVTARFFEFIKL